MEPGFKALDFFLLRTPRLPSSVIHKLNGFDNKEAAWAYVNELLLDPEILDAIYLASEDLFHEMLNHLGCEYTQSKSKLLTSLYKYVNRMAGRPTPYGKFAGISVGEVGEVPTRLELSGMLGVDKLLTAFGLDIPMKMSLMTSLRDAFLEEFSDYDRLKYKMDVKYRENRPWIEKFINLEHEDAYPVETILAKRTDIIQEVTKPLDDLDRDNCFELLSSLSHMFINRLFPISQREQEMVIYHFLTKHYMSIIKREKPRLSSAKYDAYQRAQAPI